MIKNRGISALGLVVLIVAGLGAVSFIFSWADIQTSKTIESLKIIYQVNERYPELVRDFEPLTVESVVNETNDSLRFETSYLNYVAMSVADQPTLQVETESGVSVLSLRLLKDHQFEHQSVDGVLASDSDEIGVALQPQLGVGVFYTVIDRKQINDPIAFELVTAAGTYVTMNGEGAILVVEADSQSDADSGRGISVAKLTHSFSLAEKTSIVESKLVLTEDGFAIVFKANSDKTSPVASFVTVLPTLAGSSFYQ